MTTTTAVAAEEGVRVEGQSRLARWLTDKDRIRGVVLPRQPGFDKIVALMLLEAYLGRQLDIFYWSSSEWPDRKTLARWLRDGIQPVDIGALKYHVRNTGSATDSVVLDFNIPLDPPLENLVEFTVKNNRTGYLKGRPHSIVWILRQAYRFLGDAEMNKVVRLVAKVANAWLGAKRLEPESRGKVDESLADLVQRTSGDGHRDFTVGRAIQDMAAIWTPTTEIREVVEFFLDMDAKAKGEMKQDEEQRLEKAPQKDFNVPGLRGAKWLGLSHYSLARPLLRQGYDLVVVRSESGHVVVLGRGRCGLDLRQLAGELESLEPNYWFYDERLPAILNGTRSLNESPTTGLTDDKIIELVAAYVRRVGKDGKVLL